MGKKELLVNIAVDQWEAKMLARKRQLHQIWNTKKRRTCGVYRCPNKAQQACFTCKVMICPAKECLNRHLMFGRGTTCHKKLKKLKGPNAQGEHRQVESRGHRVEE